MRTSCKYILSIFCGLFILFQGCTQTKPTETKKILKNENFNFEMSPKEDFNEFANGGWYKNNELPDDKVMLNSFTLLKDRTRNQLKEIFTDILEGDHSKETTEYKIKLYYTQGMDSITKNKEGYKPINTILEKINSIKSKEEIKEEIIHLYHIGIPTVFTTSVGTDLKNSDYNRLYICEGGLGLPSKEKYQDKDLLEKYTLLISNMFSLLDMQNTTKRAQAIVELESKLSVTSLSTEQKRDNEGNYHKMGIKGLIQIAPKIDWDRLYKSLDLNTSDSVIVLNPTALKEVSNLMEEFSTSTLKDYLIWNVINQMGDFLSDDFHQEKFNFYGKEINGVKKDKVRWKIVQGNVEGQFNEAIGKFYVDKYFSEANKKDLENLIQNLKEVLHHRISNLEWMSDETKQKAIEKLNCMNVKVGYPNKWKDYSQLVLEKDSYVENALRLRRWNNAESNKRNNKKVDKEKWDMSPQTVNAYYSPDKNEIVFPASILQNPFYDANASDEINYSRIGSVIAHEITHAFDDQGCRFDKEGNLKNWWTDRDLKKFKERAAVMSKQFSQFKVNDTLYVNGNAVLGESIADLGGLKIAYEAYKKHNKNNEKIDGFTQDQRFFISFANLWAGKNSKQIEILRTQADVHPLGKHRVLGTLRNMPEFYKAFDIKEGDGMYLPKEERVNIW